MPEHAGAIPLLAAHPGNRQRGLPAPPLLRDLAGWTWRTFQLIGAVALVLRVARELYLVSLPVAAALIPTALLSPASSFLRQFMSRGLAVLITVVVALGAVGGLLTWVVQRTIGHWPRTAPS